MLEDWKKKYKEFCEWQKTPYQVNPMSEEEHICTTCGRHFVGNYCPQCGPRSSRIGRYSFKKAILLFSMYGDWATVVCSVPSATCSCVRAI